MKLNYRDKVVLTVVIVVLVWVLGILFFIKPAISDLNTANKNLKSKKVELQTLQDKIEEDKDLPKRISDAYAKVTADSKSFYNYQEAQEATQQVDDLLDKAGLENTDMDISDYQSKLLTPYTYAPTQIKTALDEKHDSYTGSSTTDSSSSQASTTNSNDKNQQTLVTNKKENGTGDLTIGYYEITFDFKGSVANVKNFCDKLVEKGKERSMIVSELEIKDVRENEVEASMTLQMMVINKLSDPSKLSTKVANNTNSSSSTADSSSSAA